MQPIVEMWHQWKSWRTSTQTNVEQNERTGLESGINKIYEFLVGKNPFAFAGGCRINSEFAGQPLRDFSGIGAHRSLRDNGSPQDVSASKVASASIKDLPKVEANG
jgi:hypothetical protein